MAGPLNTALLDPGKEAVSAPLTIDTAAHRSGLMISCLMLSRGALSPARHAIACWQRQTYSNRELVIVCDTAESPLAEHVASLDDPAIRIVVASHASLGELRNASIAHAKGDLVCQWDDDDLYHPQRLELMAAALESSGAAAAFLARELLWWPARRALAVSQVRIWEGTMLARRQAIPVYPAVSREEDTFVAKALRAHHRLILIDQPLAYCYVVHGRNTCEFSHFDRMFRLATRTVEAESYAGETAQVQHFLPLGAYATELGIVLDGPDRL